MMKNYLSLLLIVFSFIWESIYAANYLLDRQWQVAPHTDWGTQTITCAGQLIEANGRDVLLLSSAQSSVQKTWTGLPSHYRLLVRMDYVVIDTWTGQSVSFYVDGTLLKSYSYGSPASKALKICGDSNTLDIFERVQFEVPHSASTLTFKATYSGGSSKQIGLMDLQLYLDTCHSNCSKCSGPNINQCTSCNSPATLSGNKCGCPAGQYMWQGNCQATCTGNLRVNTANTECEEILCKKSNCLSCDTDNYSCLKCIGSQKKYQGSCVVTCPSYTNNIGGTCVDITANYWNGYMLFKGFHELDFSSFTFNSYGFAMSPISPQESSAADSEWAYFSDCSDNSVWKRFYAGFGIFGKTVNIKKTFQIVDESGNPIKHSSILVKFYYLQAENYETLLDGSDEEVQIKINGVVKQKLIKGGTEMGCGRLDQGENYGWIEANSTATNGTFSFDLEISNNFQDPAWYEGFGMREMVVIVERCVSNCVECGDYDGCVRCDTGYYLWRAQCYKDKCPDGAYHDTSITTKKVCGDCNPTCLTCDAPGIDKCLTCQDPRLFKSNYCLLDCGQGFYPKKPNCDACNSECYYCDGPTRTDCKKCTGSRYYYKLTRECLTKCPDTFYENASTNTCDPCNSKCLTCSGPSENQCLSCSPPSKFLYTTKCDSACPAGYYGDKADQKCKACVSPCLTCKDTPNTCTSCILGLFLSGISCIPTCPSRYYGNLSSQVCEKCHVQCAKCKGPTSSDCLSCDDEDGYFDPTTNRCVSQCPSKYYPTRDFNNEQVCALCYFACTECKSPGDKFSCTRCSGGRYLTYNNECEQECPDFYYKDSSNFVCKPCHPSCLSCINDSSSGCLSCIKGRYLNQNMCLIRCPDGTYPDDDKSICLYCHPSCANCNGDLFNNCTRCQLGKYLQDSTCSEKCKDGYYPDQATGYCLPCHQKCQKCTDGTDQSCLSCKSPLYLNNNSCYSKCPDGTYQNNISLLCDICPYTCKTCLGIKNDECLSCSGNRYLVKPGLKCESICPQGFFPNASTNECEMCSLTCKNCFGAGESSCKECSKGSYLYQNQCKSQCPLGYFPTEQPNICNECHYSCSTCSGSLESQCESCSGDRYYLPHKCLLICPDKYFGNTKTNTCDKCDSSCKTCFGVNNNQCLSCYDDKLLLNFTCIDSCPDGYVASLDHSQCLQCKSTCDTCSPSNVNICLTCKPGWYMHSNACYQLCPDGTYPSEKEDIDDPTKKTLICKNCIDKCLACNGQTEIQCTKWEPPVEESQNKLIFWIFLGKSGYCTLCFFLGFYLDYKAQQKPKIKVQPLEDDENEMIEAKQRLQSEQNRSPDRLITPMKMNGRNPSVIPLQIQPLGNNPHSDMFDGYNPNITAHKNSGDFNDTDMSPNPVIPVRSSKRGFSLIRQAVMANKMLSINKNIKKKSDKEIKDLIAPQGGTADYQINYNDGQSQNGNEVSMQKSLTKISAGGNNKTIEGNSTGNLFFNSPSTTLGLRRTGTYSNLNQNNGQGQLKGYYDPITNTFRQAPSEFSKRQLPDKSYFYFMITFFEFTSLLFYYNKDLIRPLRALIYYCKLLFLFWITSRYLSLMTAAVMSILIGLQLLMIGIERFVGFMASSLQKTIAIIFTVFVILILYDVVWFFTPELRIINYDEDFHWSFQYLITFAADFIVIQFIFITIQYWYTKNNIFKDLQKDKITKILSFFLFKNKFADWMKK